MRTTNTHVFVCPSEVGFQTQGRLCDCPARCLAAGARLSPRCLGRPALCNCVCAQRSLRVRKPADLTPTALPPTGGGLPPTRGCHSCC